MKVILFNKKVIALFLVLILCVLPFSLNSISANAVDESIVYRVYDSQTGTFLRVYTLGQLPISNNARTPFNPDTRVVDYSKSGTAKLLTENGYAGSGFVVDEHVIATASHCVIGTQLSEILLFNSDGSVALSATPVETHVTNKYFTSPSNYAYDYALVTVEEDLTDYMCYNLGVINSDLSTNTYNISLTGFPQTVTGVSGAVNSHSVHNAYTGTGTTAVGDVEGLLYYTSSSSPGNSGGPTYVTETIGNTSYYTVVAVHTLGVFDNPNANSGVKMNIDMIQFYLNNENINY